ncbi:MAG: hypothetical protein KGY99_00780 [Phycisphaerae bacterium]|nr:hypothetical protein [Phycisphaerae bacterium]
MTGLSEPTNSTAQIITLSVPAEDITEFLAVMQLTRQIGVTCKLCRRARGEVHLIPIKETYKPKRFVASSVVCTLRVPARIRPTG